MLKKSVELLMIPMSLRALSPGRLRMSQDRDDKQYEADGIPLVIEHWNRHQSWNSTIFSLDWLLSNMGDECMTSNVLRSMISYSQLL